MLFNIPFVKCIASDFSLCTFSFFGSLYVASYLKCFNSKDICTADLIRSFCLAIFYYILNSLYSIFLLLNYHLSFLVSAPVLVFEIIIIIIITSVVIATA